MQLFTTTYTEQVTRLPKNGRHIIAQFDDEGIVVYQAYRPAIGEFAAKHGYFGGEFSLNRMSWIKPNLLWMMYRWGWADFGRGYWLCGSTHRLKYLHIK